MYISSARVHPRALVQRHVHALARDGCNSGNRRKLNRVLVIGPRAYLADLFVNDRPPRHLGEAKSRFAGARMVAMTFPVFAGFCRSCAASNSAPIIDVHSAVARARARGVAVAARGAIFYVETARSNRE